MAKSSAVRPTTPPGSISNRGGSISPICSVVCSGGNSSCNDALNSTHNLAEHPFKVSLFLIQLSFYLRRSHAGQGIILTRFEGWRGMGRLLWEYLLNNKGFLMAETDLEAREAWHLTSKAIWRLLIQLLRLTKTFKIS